MPLLEIQTAARRLRIPLLSARASGDEASEGSPAASTMPFNGTGTPASSNVAPQALSNGSQRWRKSGILAPLPASLCRRCSTGVAPEGLLGWINGGLARLLKVYPTAQSRARSATLIRPLSGEESRRSSEGHGSRLMVGDRLRRRPQRGVRLNQEDGVIEGVSAGFDLHTGASVHMRRHDRISSR